MTSACAYWPLPGLRLRVPLPAAPAGPELELRLPDATDLAELATLAADGVHDPATQPFAVAWTDAEPAVRALATMQYHWMCWSTWTPAKWELNLVAVRDGIVVGSQGISGTDFAVLREVGTGSWVGRRHHGQGIGTAMRTAVLALAFDGLDASYATSEAFSDNTASLRVSRRLGYADDGIRRQVSRGRPVEARRLRIDRNAWRVHRTAEVTIEGLEPCLALFGAD